MTPRRILFLDATGLTVWLGHGGHIEPEGSFPQDPDGQAAFAAYLGKRAGSIYYLLAEVADEGFHPEDIPAVRGRDRIALIKRKLAQYYHGTPLTVALAQGRRREGRRDERMVFAALTRPQQFEPWLDALRRTESALAGVFSVPQAIAPLALHLGRAYPRFLLITLTRGGLRQTFFDAGLLRFSRLTVCAAGMPDEVARACAAETAKVRQYLVSHRLLDDDTPLPVLVLAHAADEAAFRSHCRDSHESCFEYPDLAAAARHCGLKSHLPDSCAEALFAHLLLRHTPRAQFAHADHRRSFHLRRIRLALGGTALALLAGGLSFAGKTLLDAQRLEEDTALVRRQVDDSRQKYQALLDALPPLPLPPDQLHAVIDRHDELLRTSRGPGPLVRQVGQALDHFPAVELDRLDWTLAAPGRDAATTQRTEKTIAAPQAVIELHGRLGPDAAADRRRRIEIVEGLADRLRSDAAVQAQVLSQPYDVASGRMLNGGGAAAEAPKFSLRVTQAL